MPNTIRWQLYIWLLMPIKFVWFKSFIVSRKRKSRRNQRPILSCCKFYEFTCLWLAKSCYGFRFLWKKKIRIKVEIVKCTCFTCISEIVNSKEKIWWIKQWIMFTFAYKWHFEELQICNCSIVIPLSVYAMVSCLSNIDCYLSIVLYLKTNVLE